MKLNNKNIVCSVSSGYSSVMMAYMMKDWYPDHEILYVMANTSKERIESLRFMDKCDKHFGLGLNWVEAIFNGHGQGVSFSVVDFDALKIKGEIFEQGIKKLGIPSKMNKWCNRDLKKRPIKKFADSVFGKNNYSIAIGIRADEMDRISADYKSNNVFYPLVERNITTRDRNKFWSTQKIRLGIAAYEGNCDYCFEKSFRKLMTIQKERPDIPKWWGDMMKKYSHIPIEGKNGYNSYAINGGMNFFRENKSIDDIIEMASNPFSMATDEYIYESDLFDFEEGCGSVCSPF